MVTTAFIRFIIGVFIACMVGCILCYVREWMAAQVDYSDSKAQKRIAEERKKRAAEERAEIDKLMAVFNS